VEVGSQFVVEDAGADLEEQVGSTRSAAHLLLLHQPLKAALNAFEITFDGRLSAGRQ